MKVSFAIKQDDESYKPLLMKEIEWKTFLPTSIGKAMEIVLMRNKLKAARTNINPILSSINMQLQLIRA